jgi:hypothetical protein
MTDRRIEDDEPMFEFVGLCHKCKHRRTHLTCAAFPEAIPMEILAGKVMHTKPYAGDRGIIFEQSFA